MSAFYILYYMYKNDSLETTPFVPMVLDSMGNSTDNLEKYFLYDILKTGLEEVPC